ncbi:metallophosphoesterase [Thermaerobacter marianensis DSM 12885]|uniref:Metallophosphoesterase n=1 Tax=Thermaerobacter marianensis (strain ATCC 700841 / DSM 12885 / JCM 10246 / 7p75a) TaxID=644966 RepID=E6SK34_THEM7|nr:metallophosphoesterase [Thermaerobacter marianensis]ADU51175.1 metallophosphoesterase [Thermaerobacter marianensis DSM 12885]
MPTGRVRPWQRRLALVLAAVAAAYLAMVAGSSARVTLGPFELALAVRPAWRGLTEVAVPPLGRVRAGTHVAPLALQVRLDTVDVQALSRLLQRRGAHGLVAGLQDQVDGVARRYALRLVLLAAAGGALAGLALGRRRWRRVVAASALGMLAGAGLVVATEQTYDPGAFRHAEYSGAITAAPWLLDVFTTTPAKVEAFSRQMEVLVGRLNDLYRGIEVRQAVVPQDESLRLLVVADLHNNPAGVRLVREMAAAFRPDLVLDAGDVVDWGTAPEARLVAELAELDVPYYLAPGNHDSPASLAALQAQTGVQVLGDGLVTLPGGLMVAASRDPASYRVSPAMGRPEEIQAQVEALDSLLAAAPRRPDVLVVHNPTVAGRFRGRVPAVISGHTHVQRVDDAPQGLFLNPGSTGAAGLRGLTAPREIPYGLLLLTLVPAPGEAAGWMPATVDAVEVFRLASTGFTLQRYVVDGHPDGPVSFRQRPPMPVEELPAGPR